ncbi:MAG: family 78 glycoside hydrolase catalytic domain [Clostridia bacterium]|nr:family 78 glycoside hydrolase catalytic domain [Clostridia bacterium]
MKKNASKLVFFGKALVRGICLCLAMLMVLTGCVSKLPPDQLPDDPNNGEDPGKTPDTPSDPTTPDDDPTTPSGPTDGEDKDYQPTNLKVNLLEQPFGVQKDDLRFSWAMGSEGKNVKQTAYRIVVAQSLALMDKGTYVYDSTWIESDKSTGVTLDGLAALLKDNALYYWSVQVKDSNDNTAEMSEPQPFTTAVGSAWASTEGIWAGVGDGGDDVVIATSDDWTDYAMDVEFIIDSNALGFTVRAKDTSNFYMWQFKVDNGKPMLYPHVFKNGSFVGNKAVASVEVPAALAFGIGDTINARIVCDGDNVNTYLADKNGDYVLIDERDMSEYGFDQGIIGVRTGGSEWGRVKSMLVYDPNNEEEILYRSAFEMGHNPFNRCTLTDGMLSVAKALSTTNMISPEMLTISRSGKSTHNFVFLRTELALSEAQMSKLDRAVLSVTALSPEATRQFVYNMYVNGTIVGVGPSRLGKTADSKTVLYYNSYDVTALLTKGNNSLASINYTIADRLFLSQLTLHYTDGSSEIVSNSARDVDAWRALEADRVFGMAASIGTNYYTAHANNIDTALYPHGFAAVGYDDSDWTTAFVDADVTGAGKLLLPSQTDNVSRYVSDGEVTVKKLDDGSYVVDLGKEIIGGVRFEATMPAAATLTVYYGEQLNADGSVKYKMLTGNNYTETWKVGSGKQTVETIDMLAYRYMQIVGSPVEIKPEMVKGLEIRAAYSADDADLTSDNTLLNDIYEMMDHTVKVTTQDLYVDSQSRERLAYEGDLIINLLASHAFEDDYSIGRFTAEYLYTHRTWPAEYLLFSAMFALDDYMATGDADSLAAYYDILKSRTFTDKISDEYELISTGVTGSSKTDAVLIDWPTQERDGYDANVPYNTVLNSVAVLAYENLAKIAQVLGNDADAKDFRSLAKTLRVSLIYELYDEEKGAFADGLKEDGTPSAHYSQHATAFALACGIYDSQEMADKLAETIRAQGEIRMSVYGSYFLLKGLYDSGNGDVANMLLLDDNTDDDARTWAKMMYTLGATITAEAWGEKNKTNMTFSHPWGAAPAYAIKNGMFGIQPTTAGYATFDVRFQTEGVGKASLTVPTVKGSIKAAFDSTGDGYTASVTVPGNTSATVYLPAAQGATLTVDGQKTDAAWANGWLSVTVGSGEWIFAVQ